jgi:hypothetical protein
MSTLRIDVLYGYAGSLYDGTSIRPRLDGLRIDPLHPTQGECKSCGAPWLIHPLQNTGMPGSRLFRDMTTCSYCRRPFRQ